MEIPHHRKLRSTWRGPLFLYILSPFEFMGLLSYMALEDPRHLETRRPEVLHTIHTLRPTTPTGHVNVTVQRLGERQQRGLSEKRGDFPMLRPCSAAHYGEPSVGKVGFRLLAFRREWVQCGLRCVVMREGCDVLLIGSSQVARGVKYLLGPVFALKTSGHK